MKEFENLKVTSEYFLWPADGNGIGHRSLPCRIVMGVAGGHTRKLDVITQL